MHLMNLRDSPLKHYLIFTFLSIDFYIILNLNYILSFHFRANYILKMVLNYLAIQYHFIYLITNSTGQ